MKKDINIRNWQYINDVFTTMTVPRTDMLSSYDITYDKNNIARFCLYTSLHTLIVSKYPGTPRKQYVKKKKLFYLIQF